MTVIRVIVADDEPLVRAGVRAVLTSDKGIEIIAEADDGRQAIDLVQRHRPHLVILDIRMPGTDGFAAGAEIRRTMPSVGVLMLTTFGEDDYILRALSGGASGFVLKSGPPEELIAAVKAVADQAAYLSPRVAARVVAHLATTGAGTQERVAQQRLAALTDRERQVLALLGSGLSNRQIARQLTLVEGTVKAYVSAILAGLGAPNRAAAAVIAHQAGLVAPSPPHRGRPPGSF